MQDRHIIAIGELLPLSLDAVTMIFVVELEGYHPYESYPVNLYILSGKQLSGKGHHHVTEDVSYHSSDDLGLCPLCLRGVDVVQTPSEYVIEIPFPVFEQVVLQDILVIVSLNL